MIAATIAAGFVEVGTGPVSGWSQDLLGADQLHPTDEGMAYLAGMYEAAAVDIPITSGETCYAFGDSWTGADIMNTAGHRAIQLFCNSMGLTLDNGAVGGMRISGCAGAAIGTHAIPASTSGLGFLAGGLNDLGELDTSNKRNACLNSLRAALAAMSCDSRVEETAWSFDANWDIGTNYDGKFSGGTNQGTSTEGASATYTVTTAGTYYYLHYGWVTGNGGILTFSQGGVDLVVQDTDNQHVRDAHDYDSTYGPLATRLELSTGTLTVTFSKASRPFAKGYVDALVHIPSAPRPILGVKPIVVTEPSRLNPDLLGYIRDLYDTMTGEFPNLTVCDPDPGWTP